MKITMIKLAKGVLVPADDLEADKMIRFKSTGMYNVEIKQSRNPKFLAKIHVFFKFCFEHWDGYEVLEHGTAKTQLERMRKDLTILAGFYHQDYRLDGTIRTEARSLAFENMDEEEFSDCYHAVIQAAMKHINFADNENLYNRLLSFF